MHWRYTSTLLILSGTALASMAILAGIISYEKAVLKPEQELGASMPLPVDQGLVTVNTGRIGSDDPVETAVAVSQLMYPANEEANSPGAVVLVNRNNLAEAMLAASRVQHFPLNAPLLYVEEDVIPALTRSEIIRLKPEGVMMDGNTQAYLVGTIGDEVRKEVRSLGLNIRVLKAPDAAALSEKLDNWTSTMHGDHRNGVVIANLDNLMPSLPGVFWNAHMGDGLAFVTNGEIPEETKRILKRRMNGPWLYLFGDGTVIPEHVAHELGSYGHLIRIPGGSLPEISARFAGFHDTGRDWGAWIWEGARSFGWDMNEAGHNVICVNPNGPGGWQNVLPAATLSHMGKHAAVLVVDRDDIPVPVADFLRVIRPYPALPGQQRLNHGWIVGGDGTISWRIQAGLDQLLESRENRTETEQELKSKEKIK